ncbi:MAG: response regulator [Erysipelotrichaceae bacterium]|nr:response regulator [Erysipelotrichaceae bacterium]
MYKVLIVEDESLIRKALMYRFNWQSLNCNVIAEAPDGIKGEQCIKELQPDIVITDVTMPLQNGIDMLKATSHLKYKAIIISGYSEFEYAKEAMKCGTIAYLLKPIDYNELHQALLQAIQHIEMQKAYDCKTDERQHLKTTSLLKHHQTSLDNKSLEIAKTLEYIHTHYHEKVVIEDVVQRLNCSASFLNYKFKEEIGTTFADYLNRFRIVKALELIKDNEYPLYKIATMCGFKDYKYFNHVFHKYVGYSIKTFQQLVL